MMQKKMQKIFYPCTIICAVQSSQPEMTGVLCHVTSIEKLAFIGKRGMGALEFVPEIKRGSTPGQIDIKALADLAEKIVMERENVRILPDESLTLQSLIAVGTSASIVMKRESCTRRH